MKKNAMQSWLNSSYLTSTNQLYIEELYKAFLKNPDTIDTHWHVVFDDLSTIDRKNKLKSKTNVCPSLELKTSNSITEKIFRMINAFRHHGYKNANLDPLKISRTNFLTCLNLEYYKFTRDDLEQEINVSNIFYSDKFIKLIDLYEILKKIYCGSVGVEYMHIDSFEEILWMQKHIEKNIGKIEFSVLEKKTLLNEIIQSESLERYLGIQFPGTKRFSLEGGDVLVPVLKEIIRKSAHHNIKKIILSMAHRGRLNVLVNVLNKKPRELFSEFFDANKYENISGDVKYHQGYSSNVEIKNIPINVSLLPNPSHLEIINPVAMGAARAYLDKLSVLNNNNRNKNNIVLPISIHGDAAISGQGIVQETLNMSKVPAYDIGGTIRIVINNQIGFTTSNPCDIRSSQHCTDIGKMLQIPIFHVNADDPEKVIFVVRTALNFRNVFNRDILINLVCYRRHGHNEVDEPNVTQPIMYQKIEKHPTVRKIYSNILRNKNIITDLEISEMTYAFQQFLDHEKLIFEKNIDNTLSEKIISSKQRENVIDDNQRVANAKKLEIKYNHLKKLALSINHLPEHFKVHSRVEKIYQSRLNMANEKNHFDWGSAENLAYATLLDQGISIRLSGEDTSRGTFFHRHAVIHHQINGDIYVPLSHIHENQGKFFIWDSVLSEEAALAFEYGYSVHSLSNTLVIWEAQFGDFSNGAQIVIDQFISSGEQKWNQTSGLVMLLPHGYEGQGPEHSSARIERYLQLCAENNMKICIPSTPSQIYHLLRRQALLGIRKPLIIMSPKSLLRHPMATSSFDELITGSFQKVIKEINLIDPKNITCVIMCSGKIYYDLLEGRKNNKQFNIAIIRIEQLYPFPIKEMKKMFDLYSHVKNFIWCQEEPKNQGAWNYNKNYFYKLLPKNSLLHYVGRSSSAAPAVGYLSLHKRQQKILLDNALNIRCNNLRIDNE